MTYTCGIGNLPFVRPSTTLFLAFLASARPVSGQAPAAASLWDVGGTTLARSPALEAGPTGAFWNPAAILEGAGLRLGAQVLQTPETLGLSGIVVGASQSLGRRLGVGLVFGRVQVGDLVRTTTSPVSQAEDIPVYEQLIGLALGARIGPVTTAAVLRGHDSRLDLIHASGLTLDLGAVVRPNMRLRLAASSQFAPAGFSNPRTERLYAGAEYLLVDTQAWGLPATFRVQYGAAFRERRNLEQSAGVRIGLGPLTLDHGIHHERAFGDDAIRYVLAVGLRAGRYTVLAARGGGVEGLGANYRVGLDVDFSQ